jgi:hypothetical protein
MNTQTFSYLSILPAAQEDAFIDYVFNSKDFIRTVEDLESELDEDELDDFDFGFMDYIERCSEEKIREIVADFLAN